MPSVVFTSTVANSQTTSLVDTLDSLVAGVVQQFKTPVRSLLTRIFATAEKLSHARHALESFRNHQNNGTFPPAIAAIRTPLCQISKEFAEAGTPAECVSELASLAIAAKGTLLSQFIIIKEEEVRYLSVELSTTKLKKVWRNAIDETWRTIQEMMPEPPNAIKEEYSKLVDLHEWYTARAQQIAFAKHSAELAKKMKKLSIKNSTEVQMIDADTTAAIKKTVELTLAEHLRNKKSAKVEKRKSKGTDEAERPSKRLRLTFSRPKETQPSTKISESEGPEREISRREKGKREIQKEIARLMEDRSSLFDVRKAFTYPDSFLEVSERSRISFMILNSPIFVLQDRMKFLTGVHKLDGIVLPLHIERFLSLNLKHIFHSTSDFSLPFVAYTAFSRAVRIKWMMRGKESKFFEPRFHIQTKEFLPPPAADHIEKGLAAGKDVLLQQLPSVFPRKSNNCGTSDSIVRPSQISTYMRENQLLSCISDKNLGITIVTKDWYITQVYQHLLDNTTYIQVPEVPWTIIEEEIQMLFNWDCFPRQVSKFLKNIPDEAQRTIPRFHVIPKIHKKPWASRPIVPCHKWVLAHMAKVIDYYFQPFLKQFPWVIQSTQEFCQNITLFTDNKRGPLKNLYIGDVKAMYTNISKGLLMSRLTTLLRYSSLAEDLIHFLIQAVILVNDNCFFQFDKEVYHQVRGLAMGVACSPTLANLYLAIQEKEQLERRKDCQIFYQRYIDDIFSMSDPQVDFSFIQAIPYDDHLEVNWTCSKKSLEFLDVSVQQLLNSRITTHVRQKALNNFQYIPWSSSHPKNVKKAFVKGELTRYRTICSETEGFLEQKGLFFDQLRARGYPVKILDSWFQLVNQHSPRFTQKSSLPVPWMLPSSYNPIWDYVFVRQIKEAIVKEWSKATDTPPDFFEKRLITSFSRTMNLFDHTRIWNRKILDDTPLY
jgi:hypothetical protein